jgi:hypothetical protein
MQGDPIDDLYLLQFFIKCSLVHTITEIAKIYPKVKYNIDCHPAAALLCRANWPYTAPQLYCAGQINQNTVPPPPVEGRSTLSTKFLSLSGKSAQHALGWRSLKLAWGVGLSTLKEPWVDTVLNILRAKFAVLGVNPASSQPMATLPFPRWLGRPSEGPQRYKKKHKTQVFEYGITSVDF